MSSTSPFSIRSRSISAPTSSKAKARRRGTIASSFSPLHSAAAKRCGLTRPKHYARRQESEACSAAVKDLDAEINDRAMREFYRRGVEGLDESVVYKGEVVGHRKVFGFPSNLAPIRSSSGRRRSGTPTRSG